MDRFDLILQELTEIKQLTKETNGRVRKLELWKASVDGAKEAMGWRVPMFIGCVSAVIGAVIAKL